MTSNPEVFSNEAVINNLPTLMLWMNSGCNARCVMCEIWKDKPNTLLSSKDIAAWVSGWKELGIKIVELCGEPTIHPEMREICEILGEHDIKIGFLSNGLRLSKFSDLIVKYGKSLTVSLDGPPMIHDSVRSVPRAFERLANGVAEIRKQSMDFPIYGRCVVHRLNYLSMRQTVETARALDLTSISFFGLDTTSPAFGREGKDFESWSAVHDLAIKSEDLVNLENEIDLMETEFASEFASGFIKESPDRLRNVLIGENLPSLTPSPCTKKNVRCNAPSFSAVLEPDGSVRPCWFLPAYGNIRKEGSIEGLINSTMAKKFRSDLDVTTNPVCQKCITPRIFSADGTSRSGLSL